MLGEKLKDLRLEKCLTQKELADMLFVTPQAVSRWEKNEVEPSVGTLTELAKIFGVSVSELVGDESVQRPAPTPAPAPAPAPAPKPTPAPAPAPAPKPVLAVCEQCNRPIYKSSEIVRIDKPHGAKCVLCSSCNQKNIESQHRSDVAYGVSRRKLAYIWGGIVSGVLLIPAIILAALGVFEPWLNAVCIVAAVLCFPFISCLILKNNFIEDMVLEVVSWGFVKFPGLIFTLDLDGIICLLTVKLAFWIIGGILASIAVVGAVALGLLMSIFVYPYAIVKNYRYPEKTER